MPFTQGAQTEARTKQNEVLVDGAQFLKKTGTGIASYARTLVNTLKACDHPVSVLFGQRLVVEKGSALVDPATQIFGNTPIESPAERIVRILTDFAETRFIRRPHRTAIEVDLSQVNLLARDPPLPMMDRILNVHRLYDRAEFGMREHRNLTEVSVPSSVALAHWSGPVAVKARSVPNVYTIHDVIPLEYPYFVIDYKGGIAKLHKAIADSADLIITVSDYSKERISKVLGVPDWRIAVTHQPVPPLPVVTHDEACRLVQSVYGLEPGKYALFLGAMEPKKNLKRLIEAYLLAGVDVPLVMAGPLGWLYDEETDLISIIARNARPRTGDTGDRLRDALADAIGRAKLPHDPQTAPVRHLGFLPRRHVSALMKCARMFLFPSVSEGFGLPVLEAMQVGVPVLTSNFSSLPEVAGDAALLVDPLDVSALTVGIRTLANDAGLRADLIRRGSARTEAFSMKEYRRKLGDAYRRVGFELNVKVPADKVPPKEVAPA